MLSGFKGISFPFRINNRGGVTMSTTTKDKPTHIIESIQQIFGTNFLERPMESEIYTTVTSLLYEPNSVALQEVLKTRMSDDLTRLESRIECRPQDIEFNVEKTEDGLEYLFAILTFRVLKYNTSYVTKIRVGEVTNE